ncbi:hypothetical protein [Trabulsiella odontotermitis]|uniref:Uncharacterized protein n=1 Tax=Trabulsiella odontotermitis TaxID=379893 RepID=A0A0L0GRR8_9ENTR|nr:hypothetical protein [Trabulsiella odontotermitis]KNC91113.1 hypothetical protein GM31_02785 [Trabulsiella odontotermitis]
MSDTEKLTIDQKIEITRLAIQIYMTEFPSGHATSVTHLSRDEIDKMPNDALQIAGENQKRQDIQTDYQHIYQTLKTAIVGDSGNQQ